MSDGQKGTGRKEREARAMSRTQWPVGGGGGEERRKGERERKREKKPPQKTKKMMPGVCEDGMACLVYEIAIQKIVRLEPSSHTLNPKYLYYVLMIVYGSFDNGLTPTTPPPPPILLPT